MKSWRTITVAALVALAAAPAAFALGTCGPELNLVEVCGLAMCIERSATTSNNVGNLYPWVNSSFFFATYRNQYLYPSSTTTAVSTVSTTIEQIHSRSVSFTGGSVNNYTGASFLKVSRPPVGTLLRTFSLNAPGPLHLNITGTHRVGHTSGYVNPSPTILSDLQTQPGSDKKTRNSLTTIIDTTTGPNIMMDQLDRLGGGNSGFGVWDVTSGACSEPTRAYGSSTFFNANHLTTAFGVDTFAFVWVFCGQALPPPATVQQQVAEIIRLLLTPESLRCSGIDLVNDKKLSDDPFLYPDGKDYDPLMPRVSSGGIITGEEGGYVPKRRKDWVP